MESAPFPRASALPAPTSLTAKPPPPKTLPSIAPRLHELKLAWPRCAQIAGAFLLGTLVALLAVHALTYLRGGTDPSESEGLRSIAHRVDLNEGGRAELLQLPGIGPSLASQIEEYRATKGGFKSVEDLRKVPGIGPATLERLRPYVKVKTSLATAIRNQQAGPSKNADGTAASPTELIDINTASLAELERLPGIGPKKSQGIVEEREKRPFASVEDLRRVAGFGPKTLEKIKPFVFVGDK